MKEKMKEGGEEGVEQEKTESTEGRGRFRSTDCADLHRLEAEAEVAGGAGDRMAGFSA